MLKPWLLVLSLSCLMMPAAQAQFDESCQSGDYAVKDAAALQRFDTEMRQSLKTGNPLQMAFLVDFPLQVNRPGQGRIRLLDADSLVFNYAATFNPILKAALLGTTQDQIQCTNEGIYYGNGELWVKPVPLEGGQLTYRIEAINMPQDQPIESSVELVCETDKQRVVIDRQNSALRFRAWNKPKALTDKPDLLANDGEDSYEGTGFCTYKIWNFSSGQMSLSLAESSACGPDDVSDKNSTLELSLPGKPDQKLICR